MPQQTIQYNATIVDPNFLHIIVINNNIKVAYVYRYMVQPLYYSTSAFKHFQCWKQPKVVKSFLTSSGYANVFCSMTRIGYMKAALNGIWHKTRRKLESGHQL